MAAADIGGKPLGLCMLPVTVNVTAPHGFLAIGSLPQGWSSDFKSVGFLGVGHEHRNPPAFGPHASLRYMPNQNECHAFLHFLSHHNNIV